MTTKRVLQQAAWLWLPLLLAAFLLIGFYRSYLTPSAFGTQVTSCPQATHLDQFLGCP